MIIEQKIRHLFPDESHIPGKFLLKKQVIYNQYLINGELKEWSGKMCDVISPVRLKNSNGIFQKVIGRYPSLTEKEAIEALNSSLQAYDYGRGIWPSLPLVERIGYFLNFVEHLQKKKKEIINLLMWEIGKLYTDSQKEFTRTVSYIKNSIKKLKKLHSNSLKPLRGNRLIGKIRFTPLGVVLCMGPFNYPLYETITILTPALLMGNTVIMKTPKYGILLFYHIINAFKSSFPPGVVNIIHGDPNNIILPIIKSGKINVLAFTGLKRTAEYLRSQHPDPQKLFTILGLEAKNPAIILPDADIYQAVEECFKGSLSFNGQRCTALKIIFVHTKIVKQFIKMFKKAIERIGFGMPWEKGVMITPLTEPNKPLYLKKLIMDAENAGAKVINDYGGTINQTFFYPALLYPVNLKMRIYTEEQFGPVVPIVPFDDIQEPVQYIIESVYGQQLSIFGNDADIISKLIDILIHQVCRININSMCQRRPDKFPFGGKKDSGGYVLSITDALQVFSMKTIISAKKSEDVLF